jgi:hypothetical protein
MGRKQAVEGDAVPMICGSEDAPSEFRRIYLEVVALTDEFCNERLDTEYQELCRETAICLCQDGSPVARGKRAGWASGIVYTIGWVNFFSDPTIEPYIRSDEIAQWFGVSTGTMQSKSKIIREGLEIIPFDPDFTHPSLLDANPLVWLVELTNGLIVDIRHAPREAQETAYERGLIPYVPADREESPDAYKVTHVKAKRET